MLYFKIFVYLGLVVSMWALPMQRGHEQSEQRHHRTTNQQRRLPSTSSQQPTEPFSYFSEQPLDVPRGMRQGMGSTPTPFDPHLPSFHYQYETQHGWGYLPEVAQWSGTPYGQYSSHQEHDALFDQFAHMSMTGPPTFQVDHPYTQTGHCMVYDEAGGSQGQGQLEELTHPAVYQDQGSQDERTLNDAARIRAAGEYFKQLWTQQVPDLTKYSIQALADEVVRIEVMFDLIKTPLSSLRHHILNHIQPEAEEPFLARLHLVRHMYSSIRTNSSHLQSFEDSTSRDGRIDDLNQALSLLQCAVYGEPGHEKQKALDKVNKVVKDMDFLKWMAGNLFIKHLYKMDRSTDLNNVGKQPLREDARFFAKTTNLPADFFGKQIFFGRGDLLRSLNQYFKDQVQGWTGSIEAGVDNYSYLLDLASRNSQQ